MNQKQLGDYLRLFGFVGFVIVGFSFFSLLLSNVVHTILELFL